MRTRTNAHADADGFAPVAAAPRVALEPHGDPTPSGAVRRRSAPPCRAIVLDGFLHAVIYDPPATSDAPLALSIELGPCPGTPTSGATPRGSTPGVADQARPSAPSHPVG